MGVPADPILFWQKLHPHPTHGFFIGPSRASKNNSVVYMSAGEPTSILEAPPSGASRLLEKIKKTFKSGAAVPRFVGFLGFEAGRAFDSGIGRLQERNNPLGTPGAFFGDYKAVVKIDFAKGETKLFLSGSVSEHKSIRARYDDCCKKFTIHQNVIPAKTGIQSVLRHPNSKYFSKMVAQAKKAIGKGDIYQANLSVRFQGKFSGNPIELYQVLCEKNPSPYSALMKFGDDWLVSCSPELLVKVEGRRVVTRPIAGTRPRGATQALDAKHHGQLLLSPKERAEHVMLVDLERNDLGRACVPGSVKVTESCSVERYSHVMHIVSQVEGMLSSRQSSVDVLKAVFPGGTITGCPKIKAIEIIEKLEGVARGPFYGSAGFFCQNGDATFNILIRTALIKDNQVYIQAGAGIVADSNPSREYKEVLAKAGALLEAIKSL